VLDRVCQDQASARELIVIGNTLASDSRLVARLLAYLGASLHGTPDEAFNSQLAIMTTLFSCFSPSSPLHQRLLLPFVERFWASRFEQRRFGFSNPSLVAESLRQARQTPPELRVKAIIRAIRMGVSSQADGPTTIWLNTDG